MILTKEEFDFCAQIEEHLRKARARYNKPLSRVALAQLMDIYKRVTHQTPPRANSCGTCELELKGKVAQWYFTDKEAYAAYEGPSVAVQNAEKVAKEAARRTQRKKEGKV